MHTTLAKLLLATAEDFGEGIEGAHAQSVKFFVPAMNSSGFHSPVYELVYSQKRMTESLISSAASMCLTEVKSPFSLSYSL